MRDERTPKDVCGEATSELARQSEAKRKQAPQSEANVCVDDDDDDEDAISKKPLSLIAQDTR